MALVSGNFHTFSVFLSSLSSALRHTFHCLLECGKRLYMIRQERLERSTYCFHIINSISLNKTPDSRGSHGLWTVSWCKNLTAAGTPENEMAEGGMRWSLRRSSVSPLRFLFYPLSLFFLFHPQLESLFAGLGSLAALPLS